MRYKAPHGHEGFGGEREQTDIKMHHMLRDNLYANRQRIELSGHMKYRNLGTNAEQQSLTVYKTVFRYKLIFNFRNNNKKFSSGVGLSP